MMANRTGDEPMQAACVTVLATARDLIDCGMLGEGADSLVALRRCAHRLGCGDWQDCSCRIERAWQDGSTLRKADLVRRSVTRR